MKTILNVQRKNEIEKRLTELLATGVEFEGFYFNIGGKYFVYAGSWEGFGQILKESMPFNPIEWKGTMFSDPLLNSKFSQYVHVLSSNTKLPIESVEMTPKKIYQKEQAEEIEKLQKEYISLVSEEGLMN